MKQADPAKFAPFAHRLPNRPAQWFLSAEDATPAAVLAPGFFDSCRMFGLFSGDFCRVRLGHHNPALATYMEVIFMDTEKPRPVSVVLLGRPQKPAIVAAQPEAAAA